MAQGGLVTGIIGTSLAGLLLAKQNSLGGLFGGNSTVNAAEDMYPYELC